MDLDEKNTISHRARAFQELKLFLADYQQKASDINARDMPL
jgi:hypothetical protein